MSGNAELLVVLADAARGILSRLGGVRRQLTGPLRPVCLTDNTIKSLRKSLVKVAPSFAVEAVRDHTISRTSCVQFLCTRVGAIAVGTS